MRPLIPLAVLQLALLQAGTAWSQNPKPPGAEDPGGSPLVLTDLKEDLRARVQGLNGEALKTETRRIKKDCLYDKFRELWDKKERKEDFDPKDLSGNKPLDAMRACIDGDKVNDLRAWMLGFPDAMACAWAPRIAKGCDRWDSAPW